MKRKIKRIVYILFSIGIIVLAVIIYRTPADEYTVTFIDVGQGDSAVISGSGVNILVDAGTDKDAENIKVALDRLKVTELDLVILSHLDSDHISGMSKLIKCYSIKKIITGKISQSYIPESTSIDDFKASLGLKKIPLSMVKTGDKLKIKNVDVSVLSPGEEYGDSNDDSAVVKLKCGSKALLFTGDISTEVENKITGKGTLKADFLKVAHHGSHQATSQKFLDEVNPSFAVVSVSRYNTYNLPNVEVMNRLYGYGCKVFRTDEMGSITFHINGEEVRYESEK